MTTQTNHPASALGPRPSALPLGIGLIGCGTVGGGVVTLLAEQAAAFEQRLGRRLELRRVLVRNKAAQRGLPLDPSLLTDKPDDLFNDKAISIVVETAGGIEPAKTYITRALESGRHVVTANKALLAAHGTQLFALARKHNVAIAFEASCGGAIPMLMAMKFGLAANKIEAIYGILNGTCNYILTQMSEEGWTYAHALKEAQSKGYAEADPTLDVTGADAAQKLAIIASLAFGAAVREQDVAVRGIDELHKEDIGYGRELGYVVKLLAMAEHRAEGSGPRAEATGDSLSSSAPGPDPSALLLSVQPCFIHADEPLAQVRQAFNALSVFGHACGHVMLYGRGAGRMPTASAVVGDLLNVAGGWYPHAFANLRIWPDQNPPQTRVNTGDADTRYYLRIHAKDQPGVIARIASVLGDHAISIAAIVQHESEDGAFVPLIITTHHVRESDVRDAAEKIAALDVVRGKPVTLRIVDLPKE